MISLVTVNNHVSLLSITIAPSTFIATFTLCIVFLYIYIVQTSWSPVTLLPKFTYLKRGAGSLVDTGIGSRSSSASRPCRLRQAFQASPPMTTSYDRLDPLDRLDASLQDFEPTTPPNPNFRAPSPTTASTTTRRIAIQQRQPFGYQSHHSGFRSDDLDLTESDLEDHFAEEEDDEEEEPGAMDSPGGYSPPAWRRLENGSRDSGFWHRTHDVLGALPPRRGQREWSPEMDDDNDRTRVQGRGNSGLFGREESPPKRARDRGNGYDGGDDGGDDGENEDLLDRAARTRLPTGSMSPNKGRSPSPEPKTEVDPLKLDEVPWREQSGGLLADRHDSDNYIRFQLRADVQHKTEPIDSALRFLGARWRSATGSWSSILLSVLVGFLSLSALRNLTQPGAPRPVPDLVKVAGIARSFEPLIYFSENGASHVGELQATGVAVWDLGESVRTSNMTSAPIMVRELDDLSDSLKTLAVELTRFFADVDGDVDAILLVMDWARRELTQVRNEPSPPLLGRAYDGLHGLLGRAGVLETPAGQPTRLGALSTRLLGPSGPQRARGTLERTFNEFLAVLEEAIETELQRSLALFALFESIDRQFLNLARTVVREASAQDERHADLLSSLWTRILGGPDAGAIAKYERNRRLLHDVRDKTVRNKGILLEHNGKLLSLKASLESVRRKLVSPLVRSVNSSHLTLEDQLDGLVGVHKYLDDVRTRQKGRVMEMLYGAGSASSVGSAAQRRAIEDRSY